MGKVLRKQRIIELLKQGREIQWIGSFRDYRAWIDGEGTVRYNTLTNLWREGLLAGDFGFPKLHGTVRLKES